MNPLVNALKTISCGALAFWFPSILLHVIRGDHFSGIDDVGLTILLPVMTIWLFAYLAAARFPPFTNPFSPLLVLFGIWFFGPLSFLIEWSFFGKGLAGPDGLREAVVGTLLFPICSFIMSAYDGTLGALFFTTVGLLMMQILTTFSQKDAERAR